MSDAESDNNDNEQNNENSLNLNVENQNNIHVQNHIIDNSSQNQNIDQNFVTENYNTDNNIPMKAYIKFHKENDSTLTEQITVNVDPSILSQIYQQNDDEHSINLIMHWNKNWNLKWQNDKWNWNYKKMRTLENWNSK